MSELTKPVRVKNISDEMIWYGNARRRTGDIFYIDLPSHFSKTGKMVMLDENDKEIRHKGGFTEVKNSRGEVIKIISLKGKPVAPNEEIMQPTKEELEDIEKKAAYKKELAELNRKYQKEPQKTAAPVKDII